MLQETVDKFQNTTCPLQQGKTSFEKKKRLTSGVAINLEIPNNNNNVTFSLREKEGNSSKTSVKIDAELRIDAKLLPVSTMYKKTDP